MSARAPDGKLQVLVAGGGVAGMEATLALAHLSRGLTEVTVIAPNDEITSRAMSVREPFAYRPAEHFPIASIVRDAGARLVRAELSRVDPDAHVAHAAGGTELGYGALLLAPGARMHTRYEHAITIDDRHLDETVRGLIQDVEGGYVKRIAYVVPGRMAWPLPLYEIALMTAARAYDMDVELEAVLVTPEDSPLAIFGSAASETVSDLLARARVQTLCSSYAEVPRAGVLRVSPGERELQADRIVALPELDGPDLHGIPLSEHGFIRTLPHGEVLDVPDVYAAGDCVDFPVKHGGLASQMADAAAEAIAARAGAAIEPKPFEPVIRGMLLTGGKPLYLQARITGGAGFSSEVADSPMWSSSGKVVTKYLGAYFDARERAGAGDSR